MSSSSSTIAMAVHNSGVQLRQVVLEEMSARQVSKDLPANLHPWQVALGFGYLAGDL